MKTIEKLVMAQQIPGGADMAQKTLNAKWCQYDTKDIKCQVVPVIDVLSILMASAILTPPDLWRFMCHIDTIWLDAILVVPGLWYLMSLCTVLALPSWVPSTRHLVFGVICALMAPPGPHSVKSIKCNVVGWCNILRRIMLVLSLLKRWPRKHSVS